jgi:hypothetical protein
VNTWQADVEAGAEKITAIACMQVYFGVHGNVSRQTDLPFVSRQPNRAFETGRPSCGEQLLRIGAAPSPAVKA